MFLAYTNQRLDELDVDKSMDESFEEGKVIKLFKSFVGLFE